MSETALTAVIALAAMFGLAAAILWANDRLSRARWRRRNPPEKLAADRRAFEARLLQPDWAFYERHLQRRVPPALRELYENRALLVARDLAYADGEIISTFEPLDGQGLRETKQWIGLETVAIATTGFGDPVYLRPGPSEADTLYVTYHDGGDTDVFAESVEAMVETIRRANSRP